MFPINPISFIKDYGKIIAAAIISVILIYFLTMMTIYKSRYESQKVLAEQRLKTVTEQNAQIEEYKKNIELAKQHEQRVVYIRQKGAVVHNAITNLKSRELTNEEKDIAVTIGNRINGMQYDGNSDPKTSGTILSRTRYNLLDPTKNNPGTP